MRRRPGRWTAACAVWWVLGTPVAGAELYRWTDPDGVVRYTNDPDSIPPAHRPGAQLVDSPQPRPTPKASTPSAPDPDVIPFAAGSPIQARVYVNGVPLLLLLDTGAERTVIAPAALARAGVDPEGGRPVELLGVTGGAAAREVVVPELDVAGARLGPLTVVAHDVGVGGADGLLGRDVLAQFTLTVDAAAGRATLVPAGR